VHYRVAADLDADYTDWAWEDEVRRGDNRGRDIMAGMSNEVIVRTRIGRAGMALVGVVMALLAGCGGQATATDTSGDWVVLDDVEIDVDAIRLRGATEEAVAPVEMDRAAAEAVLPFALNLPAWVPEGFGALEAVEVVAPEEVQAGDYASVIVTWEDPGGAQVQLQVSANAAGPGLGAAGAGETVSVNGSPATLIETQGLGPSRLSLSWGRMGLDYRLTADGDALAGDDLVRMAESIP